MKRQYVLMVLASVFVLCQLQDVTALDTGSPLYKKDLGGSNFSIDMYYEGFNRAVEQDMSGTSDVFEGDQEEAVHVVRATCTAFERVNIFLEAGSADSDGSEDPVPLLGCGFNVLAFQADGFRFNLFGALRYASGIEYKTEGSAGIDQDGPWEIPAAKREESHCEVGGGFSFAKVFTVKESTTVTPYVGVLLSKLHGEGEEEFTYTVIDPEVLKFDDIDFDQEGILSAFAGLAVKCSSNIGLKLEAKFIDQGTYSAGMFFAF